MRRRNLGLICLAIIAGLAACVDTATSPSDERPVRPASANLIPDSTLTTAPGTSYDTEPTAVDSLGDNGRNGSGFIGSGH
jgi:hypothetical protein